MPYKPTSAKTPTRNPYVRRSLLSHPRNMGIFATGLLGLVLIFMLSIGIQRVMENPLIFVSMNAAKLEQTLNSTKKLSSVVLIYDKECEPCNRQLKAFRPLFDNVYSGEVNLVLVSFDKTSDAAAEVLKEYNLPLEVTPYYAAPEERDAILQALRSKGARAEKLPFTAIFSNRGRLVAEYPNLVSAQQIRSVFSIFTR